MSSTAEFVQFAMQKRLAPPAIGSVKARLRHSCIRLVPRGWTRNRVRDLWYRDGRASTPTWDEVHDIEELTGLHYARQELHDIDTLIANADRLLLGSDPDFHSSFIAAIRALFGAPHRPRT